MNKLFIVFLVSALLFCQAGLAEDYSDEEAIVVKKYEGGKISFKLKNADIRSVIHLFGKHMGVNIIAGDDVKGKVTLTFEKVSPEEALDAVLRVKGFDWSREGKTIIITTQKMVRTYSLQFANAEDVEASIKPLLGAEDSISINKSYNQIVVKTNSNRIGSISSAIKKMDVPQTQIVVEANILEIKQSEEGNAGVDFLVTASDDPNDFVGTTGFTQLYSSGLPGIYAQVLDDQSALKISAVLTDTNFNIIASPRITTLNHKEATIFIGEKLGYKTTTAVAGTLTTEDIKFLEIGTKLVLTPHVSSDGFIRMNIKPEVSEGSVDKLTGIPNESTTETQNEVLVKNGQTIVIGGLYKNKEVQTDTGVPFLMHLPFVGGLFRRTVINNENRELMVFIKPTIITPEYLQTMSEDVKKFIKKEKEQTSTLFH